MHCATIPPTKLPGALRPGLPRKAASWYLLIACSFLLSACGGFSVRGEDGEMREEMYSYGIKDFSKGRRFKVEYDLTNGVTVEPILAREFERYGLPINNVKSIEIEETYGVKSPAQSMTESAVNGAVGIIGGAVQAAP